MCVKFQVSWVLPSRNSSSVKEMKKNKQYVQPLEVISGIGWTLQQLRIYLILPCDMSANRLMKYCSVGKASSKTLKTYIAQMMSLGINSEFYLWLFVSYSPFEKYVQNRVQRKKRWNFMICLILQNIRQRRSIYEVQKSVHNPRKTFCISENGFGDS